MQTANELRRLLDDLLRRNGTVTEGDIADKVGEFINSLIAKYAENAAKRAEKGAGVLAAT